jgi:hypothetical protein
LKPPTSPLWKFVNLALVCFGYMNMSNGPMDPKVNTGSKARWLVSICFAVVCLVGWSELLPSKK